MKTTANNNMPSYSQQLILLNKEGVEIKPEAVLV
jgi:hypothetical protein